ncbi:MAG: hypothetical protein L6243_06085 [Candidatus Altiarchaeales archaeon]|nr:hypothetical protein [Candidatus Altiarchaeota archaeon]MBU4341570.1 hypothetical protein [Candidatus Altiarchaeota archaeon]MBU4437332.1 hypothetical protein [Candidatus Altiarchaeota archaeon]MCG2783142.1 hypothetical protein [Candidatus Altiarchaeales archaeon]
MKTCPICGEEVKSKLYGKFCKEACQAKSHSDKPGKKTSKKEPFTGNRLIMENDVWYIENVKNGKPISKKVYK